jgi:hypothetical protein
MQRAKREAYSAVVRHLDAVCVPYLFGRRRIMCGNVSILLVANYGFSFPQKFTPYPIEYLMYTWSIKYRLNK